ncbi:MAG: 50S ribosomal protein L6 [Candidatus Levybacteria bacterium RBG_16_35_11]|nr:MAG: 50S ribosomal protein L6 [Candidatus Levybacteria bacterium RBG_16_35_11]
MSKIGKKTIEITDGVSVSYKSPDLKVVGVKGELFFRLPKEIDLKIEDNKITVLQKKGKEDETKALFGLSRAIIANMITGVSKGFEKKLELSGVGYRAVASGNNLTLSLGYSHPVNVIGKEGITFSVTEGIITISGADKELVGNTAAKIRSIRPPEPYKGKGIKYVGEKVRRKAGKVAKTIGGK